MRSDGWKHEWRERWRGGGVSGGRDGVVQSSQKLGSIRKKARQKMGSCFTLAVCKLIPACPHKDETSGFHLGRRQVSCNALDRGEKIHSWLTKD